MMSNPLIMLSTYLNYSPKYKTAPHSHVIEPLEAFSHYSLLIIDYSRTGHHRGIRRLGTCDLSGTTCPHFIVFLQISSLTKCNWSLNRWRTGEGFLPPPPQRVGAIHFANLSPIQTPRRRRNDQLGEEGQSTSPDSQQNCAKPTYAGVRLAHDSVGCVAGPRTNQVTHQTLTIPTRTQLLPPLC